MTDGRTSQQAEMLANRVRKNRRHLRKWARREQVSCYRIYDRDIPEVPVSIDWYDGDLLVYVFDRGGETPTESWVRAMVSAVAGVTEVDESRVFVKHRRRQRGRAQYERLARTDNRRVAREGGHGFWINLVDYLDTGLFLDHRALRARVEAEAQGRRFLNLFCYTAAFTVYAAAGGARTTTSVDMSRRYLDWGRDNLALNDLDAPHHAFLREDVVAMLEQGAVRDAEGERFDLVVLDPPTFSNSKRMDGVLDTRRDHGRLIDQTLALLSPGGVLYFSSNARKLSLDGDAVRGATVTEITAEVAPPDFRKTPHRCWRIVRG